MERRDQVLRLQAQLEAKRLELAQLQQRVHKAEICRRSQVSGHRECSQHNQLEGNDDQAQSTSTTSSRSASQDLVRSLTDPHSPVWLSGQHYPAQYLIRQTRSMSRAQRGVAIMPQPPPSTMVAMEDFDLPDDDMFYPLKQQRLRNSPSCNQLMKCQLQKDDCPPVALMCAHHIQCVPGEACQNERTDGRLVVKEGGTFAVLFDDSLTVCPKISSNHSYSYSLSKVIICFDYLSTGSGVVLMAIAHLGEIIVLVLSGGHWQRLTLSTEHLVWPVNFACQYMSMSELSTESIIIAVYCCDEVCVWSVSQEQWLCEVVCSFSIPRLCSLFLLRDVLLATSTDHHLIISSVVAPPPSPLREVPLSCCCPDQPDQQALPLILAAVNKNNCLLIVLTFKSTSEAHLHDAGWIVALRDSNSIPYLLHTYHIPQPTLGLMLVQHVYTPPNKLWRLVGVADSRQLLIWSGTQPLPSETVNVEGTRVSGLAWDTVSNSCLVLDKFQQVHCFQNTIA